MSTLIEDLIVVSGFSPRDIGTADITGAYISMSGANRILAVLSTESLTAGKIATIELLQATSAAGAGAKTLKTAVTGTAPVGNGAIVIQIEAAAEDFDTKGGFSYFAVKATSDESGKLGSAVVIKGGLRYSN